MRLIAHSILGSLVATPASGPLYTEHLFWFRLDPLLMGGPLQSLERKKILVVKNFWRFNSSDVLDHNCWPAPLAAYMNLSWLHVFFSHCVGTHLFSPTLPRPFRAIDKVSALSYGSPGRSFFFFLARRQNGQLLLYRPDRFVLLVTW